jgi:hypothetical protein
VFELSTRKALSNLKKTSSLQLNTYNILTNWEHNLDGSNLKDCLLSLLVLAANIKSMHTKASKIENAFTGGI